MNHNQTKSQWKQKAGQGRQASPIRLLTIFFCIGILQAGIASAQCPTIPVFHSGEATFYTFASGGGACLFDPTPNNLMVGAMNGVDYANSQVCGECVSLTGPNGTIVIRIVDLCPECPQGDIDLSPLAFSMIADTSLGRVPITWRVIQCEVTGPIQYHFKDGSNQWWTAVQIRNHRHPILSLEYLTSGGTYQSVQRLMYNYFVEPAGMGPGPYTFRVTDIYSHVLIDSGIPHIENGSVPGQAQFPPCDDPLPIQLGNFTGTMLDQQKVRLNWTTLSEISNYGFEVQKSGTLTSQYRTIPNSFIPGHGTTNEPRHYSWIDSAATPGERYYRLKQIDLNGSVHYSDGIRVEANTTVSGNRTPTAFSLDQNYPNPFNPVTTIAYAIPKQITVRLEVYNLLGHRVALLVDKVQTAGFYSEKFDGGSLASGVYFYRLQAGSFVQTRKLMIMQ